ncbi:hypothetical protein CRG98_048160 [Punica granatum]|nr:hypothetical protein CRG98_048160 [Punica granatum]
MELPQPRPFGGEGRKPTHDFLSLCSHPNLHQDPRSSSQGNLLKTHDFLGKTGAKEEVSSEIPTVEKPPPPAPPPSVEHILPGGIGTYSISHISCFNQRVPKSEATVFTVAQTSSTTDRNDDNSNCSSYTNSGFTLWEESVAKKGKTGKENLHTAASKEPAVKLGQWASSDMPSQSSSSNNNNHRNSFNSLSSLQASTQKNQSFMDMIKSAKAASSQEEELDDEEEFVIKKEISPAPRDLRVKVDGKSSDQKANTPRSKHSATEQRRRSKINDRFQMLRTLLPQNDQKRDKASFLLEVIEYIQFLQERVQKYEGSYPGWNYEPAKMMTWQRSNQRPNEAYVDHSRSANGGGSTLVFATKNDENNMSVANSTKNHLESDSGAGSICKAVDHLNHAVTNKGVPFPLALQPNILAPVRTAAATQLSPVVSADLGAKAVQPQSQTAQGKPFTKECTALNDKLKEQELAVEGGTISISSAYSRGLFNTLTQALHSSGVDLSQASISVQIELGKRAKSSIQKDNETPANQGMTRPRVSGDDSDQALKKLKTGKS